MTLQYGELLRDPGPRGPAPEPGRPGGHHHHAGRPGQRDVLRGAVVPARAGRPAVLRCRPNFGIVDYGHRATPDVFLNSAFKTKGIWNSSQYSSAEFDSGLHGIPDRGRRRRPEGRLREDRADHERRGPGRDPVLLQLPVRQLQQVHRACTTSALGQMFLSSASARLVGCARWERRADHASGPTPRPRVTSQPTEVADGPVHLAPPAPARSSRCGSSPPSSSSSPTSCRTTSVGRSSGRSPLRRPWTRSTRSSARIVRSSSSYVESIEGLVTLNFGNSYRVRASRSCRRSCSVRSVRSAKLAGLALVITIPLSIAAGLYAARRRDQPAGPGHRPARGDHVVHPRVRHRHDPRRRGRRPASAGCPSWRRRPPTPTSRPRSATC